MDNIAKLALYALLIFIIVFGLIMYVVAYDEGDDEGDSDDEESEKEEEEEEETTTSTTPSTTYGTSGRTTSTNYSTKKLDESTAVDPNTMVYCLNNDGTCDKMAFGECNDDHQETYLTLSDCNNANTTYYGYCLIDDNCEEMNVEDRNTDCKQSDGKQWFEEKLNCEESLYTKYCKHDGECIKIRTDRDTDLTSCDTPDTLYDSQSSCISSA